MTIDPGTLDAGESVIWSGRPRVLAYAFRKSFKNLAIGLLLLAFVWFWSHGALDLGSAKERSWMFGAIVVAIGGVMALSPFWQMFRGGRSSYVLTNCRALTIIDGPFGRRLSVPLKQIGFVDVRPGTEGSGDIYFKETAVTGSEGGTVTRREGFMAIPDVMRVERLLRDAIDRAVNAERRG
jgi:hypothetical protein